MENEVPLHLKISWYLYEVKTLTHSAYSYFYELIKKSNKKTGVICNSDKTPMTYDDIINSIAQNSYYINNMIDTCIANGLLYVKDDKYIVNPYLHTEDYNTLKRVYKLFDELPEWNSFLSKVNQYYLDNIKTMTLKRKKGHKDSCYLYYEHY